MKQDAREVIQRVWVQPEPKKAGYTIGVNADGRFAVCTGECKKGDGHEG